MGEMVLGVSKLNEVNLQWIQGIKFIILGVFSMLYGFGGISGKWKRRIIAPVIFTAGIAWVSLWTRSFSLFYLLCVPLLFGALSVGYGADLKKVSIKKRSRYGLLCALASLPIFWVNAAWSLLALHILICTLVSVIAGVCNQTSSARAEESLIGASIILVPLFTI